MLFMFYKYDICIQIICSAGDRGKELKKNAINVYVARFIFIKARIIINNIHFYYLRQQF